MLCPIKFPANAPPDQSAAADPVARLRRNYLIAEGPGDQSTAIYGRLRRINCLKVATRARRVPSGPAPARGARHGKFPFRRGYVFTAVPRAIRQDEPVCLFPADRLATTGVALDAFADAARRSSICPDGMLTCDLITRYFRRGSAEKTRQQLTLTDQSRLAREYMAWDDTVQFPYFSNLRWRLR